MMFIGFGGYTIEPETSTLPCDLIWYFRVLRLTQEFSYQPYDKFDNLEAFRARFLWEVARNMSKS